MAVIQISKIQQRRGQKQVSGMPQLSSAELAWAVDTQELFIGNGSIVEGAPYVGNTKILTEHDNILELASSYRFASSDNSIVSTVFRPLQEKLDEYVSVFDFGAIPDGSTDCAAAFTAAFAELFQNVDTRYRKVLLVPNGTYLFANVLRIPSNVIIRGETMDNVILDINSNGVEFLSANNTDQFGFSSTDRPENILVSNLTISYTTGETNLNGVKGTTFSNVKFMSDYVLGDAVSTSILANQTYELSAITVGGNIQISGTGVNAPYTVIFNNDPVSTVSDLVNILNSDTLFDNNFVATRSAESLVITATANSGLTASQIAASFTVVLSPNGITNYSVVPTATNASSGIENTASALSWTNTLFGTRTTDITFHECNFESVPLAIKCLQTVAFETEVKFLECKFFNCDTGVYINGQINQVNNWLFNDCQFEEIAKQVLISTNGTGTVIARSRFKNCGNGVNGAEAPEYFMVEFGTTYGNVVTQCISDRHQAAGITDQATTVGFLEVHNGGSIDFVNDFYSEIYLSDTFTPLAVFSSDNRYIVLDYVLALSNNVRKGQLILSINDTMTNVAITDSYSYSPSGIADQGGAMMTTFEFNAQLKDNDGNTNIDTVLLTYKNPLATGATGTISYSMSYGV